MRQESRFPQWISWGSFCFAFGIFVAIWVMFAMISVGRIWGKYRVLWIFTVTAISLACFSLLGVCMYVIQQCEDECCCLSRQSRFLPDGFEACEKVSNNSRGWKKRTLGRQKRGVLGWGSLTGLRKRQQEKEAKEGNVRFPAVCSQEDEGKGMFSESDHSSPGDSESDYEVKQSLLFSTKDPVLS